MLIQSNYKLEKKISVIPCRVSSDPHEKRNDLSTLLDMDPAK